MHMKIHKMKWEDSGMKRTRKVLLAAGLFALMALVTYSLGEAKINYPAKNIQIIVNRAAGGGSDTVARMIGAELESVLGKSVTVLNKDGGDGVIGTNQAAKAKTDGYTLTVIGQNEIANMMVNGQGVQFTPESFKYIASFNIRGYIFTMKKGSQFDSLDKLIRYAKANPKKITIGIPSGAVKQTAVDVMNSMGVEFTIVNCSSGNQVFSSLLGGHIETGVIGAQFYDRLKQEGCNVFAQTVSERKDGIAEVPTFQELGYDAESDTRMLLAVPEKTPNQIIKILSDAVEKSFVKGGIVEKLKKGGETPKYMKGKELAGYLKGYFAKEISNLKKTKASEGK
jgi:tripartite-type tricarboxylate transporter receptor subunit TctC